MTRRDALSLIVATGATAACTTQPRTEKEHTMTQTTPRADAVLSVKPLGFPWKTPDPFLFCVHHDDAYPAGNERFGPAASLAGRELGQDFAGKDGWRMYHGQEVPGFPQHPHRGFETVTVVRHGLLDHSDSLGAAARYGQGDVQWLTAGKGILHSEMFPLLHRERPNPLELFQIWLNLPRVNKLVQPNFAMFWDQTIPRHTARDAEGRTTDVTIVAGRLGEQQAPPPPPNSWAAQPGSDVAIWTIKQAPGAKWTLPAGAPGSNRNLYVFKGAGLRIGGRAIPANQCVELRADVEAQLENGADATELLMLQGRPINEPVVQYGPFVMNSQEEIRQTMQEYQRTQFGGWPWPSDEPVHPKEENRFARYTDGHVDRPA
jgi:redox-sensitive bicupin YhaK (pirin superfamily)